MKLWAALYAAIWIVLLEILLGLWPNPPAVVPYLHLILGLIIVGITYSNRSGLVATRVPGRVKRIANATFGFSIVMVLLGLLLWFHIGSSATVLGISVWQGFLFLHVIFAMAIITQMAAAAIAYDMWEDREFDKETAPGEVPPSAASTAPVMRFGRTP